MNVLSLHKNLSDSLTVGRLHPQLQPNTLLVDGERFVGIPLYAVDHEQILQVLSFCFPSLAEFQSADMEQLKQKGHTVQRVGVISLVEGTRRSNDVIIGVKDPRSVDASALTMFKSMP